MAEERNGAVPELRTLLLESELESIVGSSGWFTVIEGREERKGTRLRVARLDYTPTG
jgi:hypothetical protein